MHRITEKICKERWQHWCTKISGVKVLPTLLISTITSNMSFIQLSLMLSGYPASSMFTDRHGGFTGNRTTSLTAGWSGKYFTFASGNRSGRGRSIDGFSRSERFRDAGMQHDRCRLKNIIVCLCWFLLAVQQGCALHGVQWTSSLLLNLLHLRSCTRQSLWVRDKEFILS